jgi:ADP-ribosylation factor related protein 1
MIGLDYAGKTTLLERIKSKYTSQHSIPPNKIPPTIGMNLAKLTYQGNELIIWDLGGQLKMRSIWEKYYNEAHCVLFVLDSSDLNRMAEVKLAFDLVCQDEHLSQIPIFIVANKMDLDVRKHIFVFL